MNRLKGIALVGLMLVSVFAYHVSAHNHAGYYCPEDGSIMSYTGTSEWDYDRAAYKYLWKCYGYDTHYFWMPKMY